MGPKACKDANALAAGMFLGWRPMEVKQVIHAHIIHYYRNQNTTKQYAYSSL